MHGVLIDSNILLDLFLDDPQWADWSQGKLEEYAQDYPLYINAIIYCEISVGFERIETLEKTISGMGLKMMAIPKEALFLAGKAFVKYRQRAGTKTAPLPDFFVGAHAAVLELPLLTRDVARYRSYFPTVELIVP